MTTRPDARFRSDLPVDLLRPLYQHLVHPTEGSRRRLEAALGFVDGIEPGLEAEVIDALPEQALTANRIHRKIQERRAERGEPAPLWGDVWTILNRLIEEGKARVDPGLGYRLVEPRRSER